MSPMDIRNIYYTRQYKDIDWDEMNSMIYTDPRYTEI